MSFALPSLIDPANLINPHPALAILREHDPVHWSADAQAWIVTRHADVTAGFRDPRLSADRATLLVHLTLRGADPTPAKDYLRNTNNTMLMKDGTDHHRLRVLGNRGFTPSALASWTPRVNKVVTRLLDAIGSKGRFELVADLAAPMPASVIAEMFGIPPEDDRQFRVWADDIARFFGGTMHHPAEDAVKANASSLALESYFLHLYELRKQQPGDDLMSLFVAGEEAGKLSATEVVAQCQLILVAGHVTTIDQLSNGIYAILRHEGLWEKLAATPELVKPAIEEMIRYDPSITMVMRVATADIEMQGKEIKAGQMVMFALSAANRDPSVFENPEVFDVTRTPNKHVGFGVGHHQCLGMNLARMEMEASLRSLLARYPRLTLDPERMPVRKCDSLSFRGFARLPVRAG